MSINQSAWRAHLEHLRVISRAEAWRLCGLSPDTWHRLEARGETPPITRLSERRLGYRLTDLQQWLDARREAGR
jgi:predicted DNA-binding transcriptional regulator AlpA